MAMSAPTATFVATLTMLTMTLVKVQGYVDGRLGLAATAEAGGRNAQGRRWAPWIRWPPRVWSTRRHEAMGRRLKDGTKDSPTNRHSCVGPLSESPLLSRRHKCLRRNASASLAGALVQQFTSGRAHLYVRLRCIGVSSPLY